MDSAQFSRWLGDMPRSRMVNPVGVRIPPFTVSRELVRKVQADCAIEVDGNADSVPWRLIGETVRASA